MVAVVLVCATAFAAVLVVLWYGFGQALLKNW
jgi:hypothetical protein